MAPRRQLSPVEMADLSGLAYALAHNPDTRERFAELVTTVDPNRGSSFSDIAVKKRLDGFERRQEEDRLKREAIDFQNAQNKQRDDLISSGKYTKEQTDDIKKVMDNNGIVDYNIGAVLYAHEQAPHQIADGPPPDQRPGATWEFPTVNGKDGKPIPFKEFAFNPTAAANNAAYQVITEFRRRSGLPIRA
jgi:hypothetical protein